MPKRVPDEFTLLCESCGYDIESLPDDAACPECGRAKRDSLPASRPGTPWQQRPSFMLRTWQDTLSHPRQTFDAASVTRNDTHSLSWGSFVAASFIFFFGHWLVITIAVLATNPDRFDRTIGPSIFSLPILLMVAVFAALPLAFLTFIEEMGIRFWGPRRGWRITPTVARVICDHASVGWVLGSVLAVAGQIVGLFLLYLTSRYNVGDFRGPMQLAPITLPALGLIAGMLTFEMLVYIGMGRMKYANRQRPKLDASMPPASMPSPPIDPSPDDPTSPPSPHSVPRNGQRQGEG